MNKYDTIKLGDTAEIKHVISNEDVSKFVDLTGDDNRLHVDKNYAKNTSYKKQVVHGMLGASFISTLIGTKLPGDGALWYAQSLEFLLPVRIGDIITVKAEVIKKNDRNRSIELITDIYNQNNKKVTAGISKVKIIEQLDDNSSLKDDNSKDRIKTALVIGATGGIGEATCMKLAEDGFNIVVHYNKNEEKARCISEQVLKLEKKSITVCANIGEINDVEDMFYRIFRKFNTLDIIVNCSTPSFSNIKFKDLEWENFQKQLNVNIKGTFNIVKLALPKMIENMYGKVINITTEYVDNPKTELAHYITSKSALEGFTKSLAIEFASKGIRFNLVSPGMTNTDLIADVPEKTKMVTAAQTPLRKLADPIDIANTVSFLSSHDSDHITGETIRINGGKVMK